jgi:site-specific DNA-methyltransferase (cytosine-N4-specific)
MKPYYEDESVTLYHGDSLTVLREMPDQSVDCCVTSPPYFGLRDYGEEGQYGLEASPAEYVETMRALFTEVRRVLAEDGTLWLNLGDSYSTGSGGQSNLKALGERLGTGGGHKADASKIRRAADPSLPSKNLLGIPWRTVFALQDDGWILRNEIIWSKPNGMPSSVTDRLSTKHEHLFLLAKSPRYWFDLDPYQVPAPVCRQQRTAGPDRRRSRTGSRRQPW